MNDNPRLLGPSRGVVGPSTEGSVLAAEAAVDRVGSNDTPAQRRAKGFSAVDSRVTSSQGRLLKDVRISVNKDQDATCAECAIIPAWSLVRSSGWILVPSVQVEGLTEILRIAETIPNRVERELQGH